MIALALSITPCSVKIYLLSYRGPRGLLNNTVIEYKLFYVLFLALSSVSFCSDVFFLSLRIYIVFPYSCLCGPG
jgi:hypothetical protein